MRPRIRTIKPEFFEDEKINSIPVGARYTAIGLMSMADDRGRIKCMLPAVRTYVFPVGDISERQFEKALGSVVSIGFAWRYEVGPWAYLWLPNFWRHQRINRPSESDLPPHPRDPYGGMPIIDALREFTHGSRNGHEASGEDSVSNHGGLTTSRAGVRFRSLPVVDVKNVKDLCLRLAGHIRRNDPKADPNPESDRWVREMRLLLADRKGDVEEVERIIDWCQSDPFWRSNILSPGKLRKQFTQLVLKSQQPSNVVPMSGSSHLPEWLRPTPEHQAQIEAHLKESETA